ncbi:reverse transcriptase [Purpureocillium lilacinum]|uniref:Reverse transcriptase n=2 Tax=Purpureocillium lilacinum TaxID=33203 RepID=A0A179FE68_PURLI|nr:reverse transcriptase [Purpureocillium lilacinum]
MLLQEVYTAWRNRRILTLVTFDTKGAYNGVCKERLIQRMRARGIPEDLLRWVEAFCSHRTATIHINGQTSQMQDLSQAGLPQGSPPLQVLFLFFNADLVQQRFDRHGGAVALSTTSQRGLRAPWRRATAPESKQCGATFNVQKTAIIHFTRKPHKSDTQPFTIKGQLVYPKTSVKVLGVTMDAGLKYNEHMATAANKGLEAAMGLRRLRGVTRATARQLFASTVALAVDYDSNVWMHACKNKSASAINRVQRVGAQAIVGTYLTVATVVAEAEAHIASAQERFWKRAVKMWTDIHTLPTTNPLRTATSCIRKFRRYHRSPFYQVATVLKEIPMEELETINPFTLAPWVERARTIIADETGSETPGVGSDGVVRIASRCSARNDVVGIGGIVEIPAPTHGPARVERFSSTIGMRKKQNPFSGELAAIACALQRLPALDHQHIVCMSTNKAAVLSLGKPRQQSGQEHLTHIYDCIESLKDDRNTVTFAWIPASAEHELLKAAKEEARKATAKGTTPSGTAPRMRSTTLTRARAIQHIDKSIPDHLGKRIRMVDTAFPGKHTRRLYDDLSRDEASVLAQLRTGIGGLNGYLYNLRLAASPQCACGQAPETAAHFLFQCRQWATHRHEMMQSTGTRRGDLSFHLGGKSPSDDATWSPNMEAVRATIRFAIATGRLTSTRH